MKPRCRQATWATVEGAVNLGTRHSILSVLVAFFVMHFASADAQEPDWQRWLNAAPATPQFTVASKVGEWELQRGRIRDELKALLGRFPERPKVPVVRTLAREDRGDYVLERFTFDNGIGADVPGVVLLPKQTSGRSPAILYCHWHGGHYEVGKEELFRTNALPVQAGPALVRRGYVVLAIDACCFGERNGRGPGGPSEKGGAGEMTASKFNLWVGRSLWGSIVRDDMMALDYLCSRPEVDTSRIGVTGISMGATRTWWLMALDDRPRVAVAVCCLTRHRDLIASQELRQHGIYYFVPGLLGHFDMEAVVALAAPRAMLFQSGELDGGSPVAGIRTIEEKVRPAWELHGKADEFRSIIYPGVGHVYLPAMWEETLRWLDQRLHPRSGSGQVAQ